MDLFIAAETLNEAEPNICNLHYFSQNVEGVVFFTNASTYLKYRVTSPEKRIFCSRKTEEKVKDKRSGMSTVSYWETNPKSYINTGPTVEKWMWNDGHLFSHICVAFLWNFIDFSPVLGILIQSCILKSICPNLRAGHILEQMWFARNLLSLNDGQGLIKISP